MKKLLIILLLVAFVSPIDLTDEQKEQIDAFIDYLNANLNLIYEKKMEGKQINYFCSKLIIEK